MSGKIIGDFLSVNRSVPIRPQGASPATIAGMRRKRTPAEIDKLDRPRRVIWDRLGESGQLGPVSKQLGKSHSYLQQFIWRGSPKTLQDEGLRANLAKILDVSPSILKGKTRIDMQPVKEDGYNEDTGVLVDGARTMDETNKIDIDNLLVDLDTVETGDLERLDKQIKRIRERRAREKKPGPMTGTER